ncbi:MAG: hypothetical protein EA401_05780 [Planctomycetota bacterium]|nr:MAG: hypothetical protein EA401_05780 [Planctomycetota bacterium]
MQYFDPQHRKPQRLVTRNRRNDPFMKRREIIVVGMLAFTLAVVLFAFLPETCSGKHDVENPGDPHAIVPMPYPDLRDLGPLANEEDIEHFADRIAEYLERPDRIFGQPMAVIIGWARQQLAHDAEHRVGLPMRVTASDVSRSSADPQFRLRNGARVALSGLLLERHPAPIVATDEDDSEDAEVTEDWYRFLIQVEPEIYFQALVRGPAAELLEGKEINLVGRYVGMEQHTSVRDDGSARAEDVSLLTIVAQQGRERSRDRAAETTRLLRLGVPDAPGVGAWRSDPSVFDNVEDTNIRLERRPYYYLLGKVLRDRSTPNAYADAANAMLMEEELHHHAPDYRGKPFTLTGQVLRAWEDWEVARDQPFGVARVIRMWLWAFVPEERTVVVEGQERHITTSQIAVYEVAAIAQGDTAMPQPGDRITATGRFFKIQRYITNENFVFNRGSLADEDRALSDSVYFKMFVSDGFERTPPREPTSIFVLKVGFLVVFTSMLIFFVRLMDRERVRLDDYKRPVRRLRKARRELRKRAAAEAKQSQDPLSEDSPALSEDLSQDTNSEDAGEHGDEQEPGDADDDGDDDQDPANDERRDS